jgi:GTP cyclohydrolase IIa
MHLTIIRIDRYGPWTLTLGSDRESALQMLQARIYFDLQRLFSEKHCIVYPNRFDEYFAITDGLRISDLVDIQRELTKLYPQLGFSMALGYGDTPTQADRSAFEARKKGVQIASRGIYGHDLHGNRLGNHMTDIRIMHIDVSGLGQLNLEMSPYQVTSMIFSIYSRLVAKFMEKDCLTFYLGGDNFMVVASNILKEEVEGILLGITEDTSISLNCGIGKGKTGREAAMLATKALDKIRELRDNGTHLSIYEI